MMKNRDHGLVLIYFEINHVSLINIATYYDKANLWSFETVENSLRVLALGRKNYLFAGSHDAAQNIAMFYSFFGTCKKLDIDAQKWLKYVMENIHITPAGNFKELLPQFIDKNLLQ